MPNSPTRERRLGVWLSDQRVGVLHTTDDYTWFVLDPAYVEDPERAVLGLRFEQDLHARHAAQMRLPPWFSNLLPEGSLREWIALQRGVAIAREVELLAEVGGDLPGGAVVRPTDEALDVPEQRLVTTARAFGSQASPFRFSLAGVQLKFSMLASGERFTAPASGSGGDWIVKLPDARFRFVPKNELAMMTLAGQCGIEVPDTRLVHRDDLTGLPSTVWPGKEEHAYAVRRFDRLADGRRVHMEDLAQVRGFYPEEKYRGGFETVLSLVYRRRDLSSLLEAVRRLAFNVLIRNGDAHLKNWTLLYRNPRVPTLSPAYDVVSTAVYPEVDSDLGLKLGGSRRFEDVTLASFSALQMALKVEGASFADEAERVITSALAAWPEIEATIVETGLGSAITKTVIDGAASMRGRR